MADYTAKSYAQVKILAREIVEKKGYQCVSVSHIHQRAFCLASERNLALFAVCPADREPQVRNDRYVVVHNDSAQKVQAGDWARVAYISTANTGEPYVVEVL